MRAPGSGVFWVSGCRRIKPGLPPPSTIGLTARSGVVPCGSADQNSSYPDAAEVIPGTGGRIDRNPFQSTATRTGGFKEGKHNETRICK